MGLWRLLGGLAYGALPSGSALIHRQCSASAALSTAQASRWRSRQGREMRHSAIWLLEVPEGPAAATSIQNNSGRP